MVEKEGNEPRKTIKTFIEAGTVSPSYELFLITQEHRLGKDCNNIHEIEISHGPCSDVEGNRIIAHVL